jgi:hypothetical protein
LTPVALLSPALGSAVIYVLNLFAFLFVMLKLKLNYWLILPTIFLSGMLINSANGNIDGILALGLIMPSPLGLFFLLAKPQISVAVIVFWIIEAWRIGGFFRVIRIFLPVITAYIISFLIFGFWIVNAFQVKDVWWNSSIWPVGIPFGLLFLGIAVWKREVKFAIAASPFLAPYLAEHSWAFVWLGLLSLFPSMRLMNLIFYLLPNDS